ncbi:MFS transporter [bacterium]|nr:MAG: MFS transporter [bacterium]
MSQIKLIKLLSLCTNLLFWNSIWLLYYLKFVNNQQIGTIELIVFFTAQIFEIPTGFIGDKVGWKKSVLFGLPFLAIGNIVMGAIPSFNAFLVSGLIMGIGDAFLSGSVQSLQYHTAKSESYDFSKLQKEINKYKAIGTVIATLVGGLIFMVDIHVPYYLRAIGFLAAFVVTLFIKDIEIVNKVDIKSEKKKLKENIKNYLTIFKKLISIREILGISIVMIVCQFVYQYLYDFSLIRIGLDSAALTILMVSAYIISAIYFHFHDKVEFLSRYKYIIYLSTLVLVLINIRFILIIISIIRPTFYQQIENESEKIILDNSKAENSASNLSVINFLRGLIYPIGIFVVGGLLDKGFFMQIMLVLILIFIVGLFIKNFKLKNYEK